MLLPLGILSSEVVPSAFWVLGWERKRCSGCIGEAVSDDGARLGS